MFKIDSEGATIDNQFTEGNPALAVPATVVSADWLNAVQSELVTVVQSMGLALDRSNSTQVFSAILRMFENGGRSNSFKSEIPNNNAAFDVLDLNNENLPVIFNKANTRLKVFLFDVERSTDTSTIKEFGLCFASQNVKDGTFISPKIISFGGDGGVAFNWLQVDPEDDDNFKLVASSTNLAGATYTGNLSLTSIIDIRI